VSVCVCVCLCVCVCVCVCHLCMLLHTHARTHTQGDIEELKGKIVPVEIIDVGAYYLVGKVVGPPR